MVGVSALMSDAFSKLEHGTWLYSQVVSSREESPYINARFLADAVEMVIEPSPRGLAADVAQMDQKRPFGVEFAGSRERQHFLTGRSPVSPQCSVPRSMASLRACAIQGRQELVLDVTLQSSVTPFGPNSM